VDRIRRGGAARRRPTVCWVIALRAAAYKRKTTGDASVQENAGFRCPQECPGVCSEEGPLPSSHEEQLTTLSAETQQAGQRGKRCVSMTRVSRVERMNSLCDVLPAARRAPAAALLAWSRQRLCVVPQSSGGRGSPM